MKRYIVLNREYVDGSGVMWRGSDGQRPPTECLDPRLEVVLNHFAALGYSVVRTQREREIIMERDLPDSWGEVNPT